MSVKTELMQQYANVMMVNERIMANGMSRLGRLASSPVHVKINQLTLRTAGILRCR